MNVKQKDSNKGDDNKGEDEIKEWQDLYDVYVMKVPVQTWKLDIVLGVGDCF